MLRETGLDLDGFLPNFLILIVIIDSYYHSGVEGFAFMIMFVQFPNDLIHMLAAISSRDATSLETHEGAEGLCGV